MDLNTTNPTFYPISNNSLHHPSNPRAPLLSIKQNKNKNLHGHLPPRSSLKQSNNKPSQKSFSRVRWSSPICTTRIIPDQDVDQKVNSQASELQSLSALTINFSTQQEFSFLENRNQLACSSVSQDKACHVDISCSISIKQMSRPNQNHDLDIIFLDIGDEFPEASSLESLFPTPAAFLKPSKPSSDSVLRMNLKYLAEVVLPSSQVQQYLESSAVCNQGPNKTLSFSPASSRLQAHPNVPQALSTSTFHIVPTSEWNSDPDQRQLTRIPFSSGIKRKAGYAELNTALQKSIKLDKNKGLKKTKRRLTSDSRNLPTLHPQPPGPCHPSFPHANGHSSHIFSGSITNNAEAPTLSTIGSLPSDYEGSSMSSLFGDHEAEEGQPRQASEDTENAVSKAQPQQYQAVDDLMVLRWIERLKCFKVLCQTGRMNQKFADQLHALIQLINSLKADSYLTPQVLHDSNLAKTLIQFRQKPWEKRTRRVVDEINKCWRSLCRDTEET